MIPLLMTSFRLLAALISVLMFSSCQMANTIMQEPANLIGSLGRALHVENDRTAGDASIEAIEAKQAQDQLAMQEGRSAAKDAAATASSEVAAR